MCTAFVRKGNDLLCGFNMDINVEACSWDIYTEEDRFYVGIQAGFEVPIGGTLPDYYVLENRVRKTMGVNGKGIFSSLLNNLDYTKAPFSLKEGTISIDQISDDLISGKRDLQEVVGLLQDYEIVNLPMGTAAIPDLGMHSLLADKEGNILILEPGNGLSMITEKYAALSNFALLELPQDLAERQEYYGLDRYNEAMRRLRESDDDFSVSDGLELLKAVRQEGKYATRVSFVWSRNENAVYYVIERDFDHVKKHVFTK